MSREPRKLLGAVLFGALVPCLVGQESPARRLASEGFAACDSAGVQELDGRILGVGPNYRVEFFGDRIRITPALGSLAPRNYPWSFELLAAGRASEIDRVLLDEPLERLHDADSVDYVWPGFTEVYDARPDGLKQSFVFSRRPAGDGDLVVRGRVTTDLDVASEASDRIVFERDGLGGVRVESVIGVDGAGRRVEGSMTMVDGEIEMRLPASFVEEATLPITLDPIVTSFTVTTSLDTFDPDVATDPTTGRSLVVWTAWYSSSDTDILGRLYDANGTALSNLLTIEAQIGQVEQDPAICFVEQNRRFVIGWRGFSQAIRARSMDPGTIATSPVVGVHVSLAQIGGLDAGGDVSGADNEAVFVWSSTAGGSSSVYGIQVQVDVNGALTPFGVTDLAVGTPSLQYRNPRICNTEGGAGRFAIVWQVEAAFGNNKNDIVGVVTNRNLTVLDNFTVTSTTADELSPVVDGDGSSFVVAWQHVNTPGDSDIRCSSVGYDPTSGAIGLGGIVTVEGDANDDEINPAITWLGRSVLIAFADQVSAGSSVYNAYLKSLDPYECQDCEGEFILELTSSTNRSLALASRFNGGASNGIDAIAVWDSRESGSSERDILGAAFEAEHGRVVEYFGGSCVGTDTILAPCAVSGTDMQYRLRGAEHARGAHLILSPFQGDYWCGTCRIVPDLFRSVTIYAGQVNFLGEAKVDLAVPPLTNLVGATVWAQWVVAGSGCNGFQTSQALNVTIE